jgi:7SK snRNA methylphosphate capping enzyme
MKKIKNEKYKYGNYDKYYFQRNFSRWNDPRLKLLDRSWFENKEVADIGCNDGTFTILIAVNYNPVHITGIEIDYKLINRAIESLVYIEKSRNQLIQEKDKIEALEELKSFPKSFNIQLKLPNFIEALEDPLKLKPYISLTGRYPSNISFSNENYIESQPGSIFDTILCLSTTKWIHLNWGDEGLKILFNKIYKSLKPQGLLILEPQIWKSYKKARNRTETINYNYHNIKLKPQQFTEYLQNLGLSLQTVITPQEGKDTFKRNIYIYRK